jgi:hypothetical protein
MPKSLKRSKKLRSRSLLKNKRRRNSKLIEGGAWCEPEDKIIAQTIVVCAFLLILYKSYSNNLDSLGEISQSGLVLLKEYIRIFFANLAEGNEHHRAVQAAAQRSFKIAEDYFNARAGIHQFTNRKEYKAFLDLKRVYDEDQEKPKLLKFDNDKTIRAWGEILFTYTFAQYLVWLICAIISSARKGIKKFFEDEFLYLRKPHLPYFPPP